MSGVRTREDATKPMVDSDYDKTKIRCQVDFKHVAETLFAIYCSLCVLRKRRRPTVDKDKNCVSTIAHADPEWPECYSSKSWRGWPPRWTLHLLLIVQLVGLPPCSKRRSERPLGDEVQIARTESHIMTSCRRSLSTTQRSWRRRSLKMPRWVDRLIDDSRPLSITSFVLVAIYCQNHVSL